MFGGAGSAGRLPVLLRHKVVACKTERELAIGFQRLATDKHAEAAREESLWACLRHTGELWATGEDATTSGITPSSADGTGHPHRTAMGLNGRAAAIPAHARTAIGAAGTLIPARPMGMGIGRRAVTEDGCPCQAGVSSGLLLAGVHHPPSGPARFPPRFESCP
jgi:hypothetical protein